MKISLVFPVYDSDDFVLQNAKDLIAFWSRFPVDVEVLLIRDSFPGSSSLEAKLNEMAASTKIQFKTIDNARRQGRGASLLQGLQMATGDVLAAGSFDWTVPLGEFFSGLQEFVMNRDQSFLLIGNRRGQKKKRTQAKQGLRAFFEGVEHEKSQSLGLQDPTSPFFMIQKKDWAKLEIKKLRSWFYTPQVILAARQKGIEVREIEVQSLDRPESRFRFWEGFF